jgi:hypothetical protein
MFYEIKVAFCNNFKRKTATVLNAGKTERGSEQLLSVKVRLFHRWKNIRSSKEYCRLAYYDVIKAKQNVTVAFLGIN